MLPSLSGKFSPSLEGRSPRTPKDGFRDGWATGRRIGSPAFSPGTPSHLKEPFSSSAPTRSASFPSSPSRVDIVRDSMDRRAPSAMQYEPPGSAQSSRAPMSARRRDRFVLVSENVVDVATSLQAQLAAAQRQVAVSTNDVEVLREELQRERVRVCRL